MALVPAGEFLYGGDELYVPNGEVVQRLSLPAFYMDKYEVTVSRYANFLQVSKRKQPEYWNQASQMRAGSRPVIGVDWYDADAYCRHYGKRLPTGQEWEKAARGTDGRKYPWGNDEPSGRYTNHGAGYDMYPDNPYSGLTEVGSFDDGKSPFGIYDLAGNVWEWTNTDDSAVVEVKEVRGGSWHDGPSIIRSTRRMTVEPSSRAMVGGFRCVQDGK